MNIVLPFVVKRVVRANRDTASSRVRVVVRGGPTHYA